MKRARRLALRQRRVRVPCLVEGALGAHLHDGVERRAGLVDASQVRLDDLDCRDLPPADRPGYRLSGPIDDVIHRWLLT